MSTRVSLLLFAGVLLAAGGRSDETWTQRRWKFCSDPTMPLDVHDAICRVRPEPKQQRAGCCARAATATQPPRRW